ncbi:MAG: methionine--tRNA ligase [Mycoplasmataceae bacterium]|nr:methionine--tRNA ligase [Mycoplasmataceae bacterium]
MEKKFYITTPIYYPSGKPHIGTAYTTILADVIFRYKKLIGFDSYFLTGLDEHGQKIEQKSKEEGFDSSQAYVDSMVPYFTDLWKKLDINYSQFIRTTNPKHIDTVQKVFSTMLKNDDIYLGEWKGLYCLGCEEPYNESEAIKKEDGCLYCRVGHKLSNRTESSYFFKMAKYTDWIKTYITSNPDFIYPIKITHEMLNNFVNKGLEDLSISRTTFSWGIPILENKKHVMYVWLDALFNYVSALGYLQPDDSLYQKFWNNDKSQIVHIVGKDIARFHTVFWPILLHSINLNLPSKVISHSFIMAEDGRKMSKSFGNVIDPEIICDKYGSDIFRYYLLKEFVLDSDNCFSEKRYVELFNSDLANIYGNIVSRTIGMLRLYNSGKVHLESNILTSEMEKMLKAKEALLPLIENEINNFNIKEVLTLVNNYAKDINQYIENSKPWEINKANDKEKINNFLFILTDAVRTMSILLSPVLVKGCALINQMMNFTSEMTQYSSINNINIIEGLKVNEASPIYLRIK